MELGAVVIPAYGKVELTRTLVEDCLRESNLVDVVIVDNAGDFPADSRVTVLRPGQNLGWLGGTNYGFEASRPGHDWLVALNNDTRLSVSFFEGLRAALTAQPESLVAPCYDGHGVKAQSAYYSGPPEQFPAQAVEHLVSLVDGTCFALSCAVFDRLGPMDAKNFGRHGWGAMEDYILRVRAFGGGTYLTRRAFLSHQEAATALDITPGYARYAAPEMRRGLRRKYGAHWRSHFEIPDQSPDGLITRISDLIATKTEMPAHAPDSPITRISDLIGAAADRVGLSQRQS
jgi:GT2 family glycosyltransferase